VTGAPATEKEVVEYLAQRLYFLLEKYDPTQDEDWVALTDHQKEIFRATIRGLVGDPYLVLHLDPTTA